MVNEGGERKEISDARDDFMSFEAIGGSRGPLFDLLAASAVDFFHSRFLDTIRTAITKEKPHGSLCLPPIFFVYMKTKGNCKANPRTLSAALSLSLSLKQTLLLLECNSSFVPAVTYFQPQFNNLIILSFARADVHSSHS